MLLTLPCVRASPGTRTSPRGAEPPHGHHSEDRNVQEHVVPAQPDLRVLVDYINAEKLANRLPGGPAGAAAAAAAAAAALKAGAAAKWVQPSGEWAG